MTDSTATASSTARRPLPRVAIVLALLMVTGTTLALGIIGTRALLDARASQAWPAVEGRITESRVEVGTKRVGGRRRSDRDAVIRYDYVVDGRALQGDAVTVGGIEADDADAMVERYPVGRSVPVHYDPAEPTRAALEVGVLPRHYAFPAASLMGLAIGALLLRRARRK
ncbi:MAG: DUF3592 domain-containing protein [Planctomycetes bacterium]|nr:DUF3592 domain-containing protein [Planctomycetota bacterium]